MTNSTLTKFFVWPIPPLEKKIVIISTVDEKSCDYFHQRQIENCDHFHRWPKKLWSFPLVSFENVTNSTKYKKNCDDVHCWNLEMWPIPLTKKNCDHFHWLHLLMWPIPLIEKKLWSFPLITFIDVTNSTDPKTICDLFHTSKKLLWPLPCIIKKVWPIPLKLFLFGFGGI